MPANLASSRPLRALSLAALALLMATPALAQSRRQGAELPQMRLSQRPLIVAHRGRATSDGAENSLVQMQQVASHQIGVEMDLAASQDGVLYLLHDATLDRTTTGTGPIKAQTSQALDAVKLKDGHGKPTDEALPRLTKVLDWAAGVPDVILMIDLKGIKAATLAPLLRERKLQDRVILLTFERGAAAEALASADGAMVSVLIKTQSDANYYKRIAAGRPLAMYVPQDSKNKVFGYAKTAGAVLVTDVIDGEGEDSADLNAKVAKQGCKAYLDYIDAHYTDVLVTNHPKCAAQTLKAYVPTTDNGPH